MVYCNDSTPSESGEEPIPDDGYHPGLLAPPVEEQLSAASPEGTSDRSLSPDETQHPAAMSTRAYQQEMLEESLKRNIIIAMDTGSGKTQVAVLRIQTELERNHKRVWFLAPTVALASQQFEVLQAQITAVQAKFLCGADTMDTWSDQHTWDAMLDNVRIVVSTYQILFDALKHGFVTLDSLALIVFDEAHNCLGKSACGRLMSEIYWPAKQNNRDVPHILGLTASPVIRSGSASLEELEQRLDAVCRSPTKHRDELMAHANQPDMSIVCYGSLPVPLERGGGYTPNMLALLDAYRNLDITEDPSILRLRAENTVRSLNSLERAIMKHDTFVQGQMKSFCERSAEICRQLGPWAADYYVNRVVSDVTARFESRDHLVTDSKDAEMLYLVGVFNRIQLQPPSDDLTTKNLSNKMRELVRILVSFKEDPMGIVFAKERATVAVLAHFLSIHPEVRSRYRVGAVVGISKPPGSKQSFLDLNRKDDLAFLQHFRTGRINLLVATSVLEEGIDVPACNLVVCFDKPDQLKSFIQRRGRARKQTSQLSLLVDDTSINAVKEWQDQENTMKNMYKDELRELEHIKYVEESEDVDFFPLLTAPSTGLSLTIDDAKSHLEHFCRTLTSRKFVDTRPYYVVRNVSSVDPESTHVPGLVMLRATVHLPISLPPELRTAESSRSWFSEKNACKDAAFQAYKALYRAGLVNEHLLPMKESDMFKSIETRPGMATVREQLDPWPMVAMAWREGQRLHRRNLTFTDADGSHLAHFEVALPVPVPNFQKLLLHWDADTVWTVEVTDSDSDTDMPGLESDDTATLLALAYGHRWPIQQEGHIVHFLSRNGPLDRQGIGNNEFEADTVENLMETHLVRETTNSNHPYFYAGWLPTKPPVELVRRPYRGFEESTQNVPYVAVGNWPKKAGYFRQPKLQPQTPSAKPYFRVLPASETRVDSIPAVYSQFGMLLPSIIHALEVHLVATELLTTRLSSLGLTDLSLVVTAICTPAAREPTDYEKIEFVGDSILKLCATGNCLAKHPDWPEGFLSPMKDQFVANSRLATAALDFGLDRYIVTKGLTLQGWRPTYVDDHPAGQPAPSDTATRQMSTKTLADVVEALIGASYLDGGLPKALACISLFLPEGRWQSVGEAREVLFEAAAQADAAGSLPATMDALEGLVGYTFRRKSLLVEAMTHSSYDVPGTTACLERLEFLGDAILDYLVVRLLVAVRPPLSHSEMHLLRTALVNGDFIGFATMEWSAPAGGGGGQQQQPLWSFMRFSSADLAVAQRETRRRHAALRERIVGAVERGGRYPWSLLARLQAQKSYSDVFESLLGAVWVDSGSFDECEAVLERAGVLAYMRRIVRDRVYLLHPREELGRLAASEPVSYVVEVRETEDGEREVACRLTVGSLCVGSVEGCLNKEEAWTRAAEEAIKHYHSLGGRWS